VPSYRAWCWKLSKLLGGMQFFLPDYTLSPEVTFPVALQQCWKAYLWILNPKVPTSRHDTARHDTTHTTRTTRTTHDTHDTTHELSTLIVCC
jgi:hypothetical protein